MTIAGTGGSHRDGIRPYPHFSANTRFALGDAIWLLFWGKICGLLLEDTGTMCRPYPAWDDGGFGHRKSGDSHINPVGSYSKRLNH